MDTLMAAMILTEDERFLAAVYAGLGKCWCGARAVGRRKINRKEFAAYCPAHVPAELRLFQSAAWGAMQLGARRRGEKTRKS
jgi:hypothetical protein